MPNSAKDWAEIAVKLTPYFSCYVSQKAIVWKLDTNTIRVQIGPNQVDINVPDLDKLVTMSKRPQLWRHLPSDLPEDWQSLPDTSPGSTNATIYLLRDTAASLGIDVAHAVFKWPDCTGFDASWPLVNLTLTRVTLIGSTNSHDAPLAASTSTNTRNATRSLRFDNLVVKLQDDGKEWPSAITGIEAEGSISKNGLGRVDLLNQDWVPRPQMIDLTSQPVELLLTPNGVARFP